jgi:hypothetical protein
MSQIIIGYTVEGTTDIRFLSSIIERTFIDVAGECSRQIEVVTPITYIEKGKGNQFSDQILKCSKEAFEKGVMAFCVHVDADEDNDEDVFHTRIRPAISAINGCTENVCGNLVPIIPVQMTESWMLADKQLLKEEIGTDMTDSQLGINRAPESIANPKDVINEAIRLAREPLAKRRRKNLTIAELYQPIGQKIPLEILERLLSYMKFKEAVRSAYQHLNYLQRPSSSKN